MSVQDFLKQSRTFSSNGKLTPGKYTARVVNVELDENYRDETFKITYEVEKNNKCYIHVERIVKNKRFDRSIEFYDHLDAIGITDELEYVGCEVLLDLRWNFNKYGTRSLTVVDREFIGLADNQQVNSEETEDEADA